MVVCGASFCVGCMALVCAVVTATHCIGTRAAVVCQVVSVQAECYLCVCLCVYWCRSLCGKDVCVRPAADRQGADETEAIEEGETALRGSVGGLLVVCAVRLCVRDAVSASGALFWVGCVA